MANENNSTVLPNQHPTTDNAGRNEKTPRTTKSNGVNRLFAEEEGGKYIIKKSLSKAEIIELAKHVITSQFKRGMKIDNMETAKNYFFFRLANLEQEVFSVLFLDNKNEIICCEDVFFGTINKAPVFPREIAKRALKYNATGVIFAHNHLSSTSNPSPDDKKITTQLKEILGILEIRVLDHIITWGSGLIRAKTYGYESNF